MRNRPLLAALGVLAALTCPIQTAGAQDEAVPLVLDNTVDSEGPAIALFTTMPILWGEAASLSEVLQGGAEQHWAREILGRDHAVRPVDFLAAEYLADVDLLFMGQPRGLAPSENVALDDWVNGGGHVLLFADPMMTGHSRFGLGDRRRPQDVILLSPILERWGLELSFDPDEPLAGFVETDEDDGAVGLPVALPGRFALSGTGTGQCKLSHGNVLARCRVGEGSVTILADAAMLDMHEPPPGAAEAFAWLLAESAK